MYIIIIPVSVCRSKIFKQAPYTFNECRNIGLTPLVTYLNFTHGLKNPSRTCLKELFHHVERMNAECTKTDTCNYPLHNFTENGCYIDKIHTLFATYACVSDTNIFNNSFVVWDLPLKKDTRTCQDPGFSPYFLTNSGHAEISNPTRRRWVTVRFHGRIVSVTVLSCRIVVFYTYCSSTIGEEYKPIRICDEKTIYKKTFYCEDYVKFTYYDTENIYQGFLFQLQGKSKCIFPTKNIMFINMYIIGTNLL